MKKGFKFTVARPNEHNENIGKSVKKAYTEERRKRHSKLMKELWAQIKNNNE